VRGEEVSPQRQPAGPRGVAEWSRLGERLGEQTPKDKLLFFLGAVLEEATRQESVTMLASVPAPARLLWRTIGRRQYQRRAQRLRAGLS
jgi:hypothetical protein